MKKDKKPIKESIIGKIIYGFLMFGPLLAILVTSLYVVINPNAKDSYTFNPTETSMTVSDATSIILDSDYLIKYVPSDEFSSSQIYTFDYINFEPSDYGYPSGYNYTKLNTRNDGFLYLQDENGHVEYKRIWGTEITEIIIHVKATASDYNFNKGATKVYFITITYSTLDNAFYYALDSVENSSYFGWSKNTAIYSVLNTTCNGLGITTTFVPMILTYWLIISVIYLIYDLVLVFIHIAHKKVHELEEF